MGGETFPDTTIPEIFGASFGTTETWVCLGVSPDVVVQNLILLIQIALKCSNMDGNNTTFQDKPG
jgi:hypothetical protein